MERKRTLAAILIGPVGAKTYFDRAIDLLGNDEAGNWPFYNFNRAFCSIKLEESLPEGRLSYSATSNAIVQDLRVARQGIAGFSEMLKQPFNIDVRKWLELNGSPSLD